MLKVKVKLYNISYSGGKQIPADIRGSVYSTVRANGGNDEYQDLLTLFNKTDLHEERDRIQRVLGCGLEQLNIN